MALELLHLLPEVAEAGHEWYHLSHHDDGQLNFDNVQVKIINYTGMKLIRTNCGSDECYWGYTLNGRTQEPTEPAAVLDPRSSTNATATRNLKGSCISSVQYTPEGSNEAICNIWFTNPFAGKDHAEVYSTGHWEGRGYAVKYIEESSGQNYWFTVLIYQKLSTPGGDQKIATEIATLSEPPSPVVRDGKIYLFHRGHGNDHLWYSVYEDLGNGNWQWRRGADCVTALLGSPSAVLYKDKIFIFHHDHNNAGELYFDALGPNDVRDGDKRVSTQDSWMSFSPSAIVYEDKIYVFYHGQGQDGTLRYNVWNGSSWEGEQRVPCGISESPSAVVYDNRIFVFYQGKGSSRTLWYSEFKSKGMGGQGQWTGNAPVPGLMMSSSPSAVAVNNRIYIFHQGAGDGRSLWCIVYTAGKFSADDELFGVGISHSPSAVLFNNTIYCFHQGLGDSKELWYKTVAPR